MPREHRFDSRQVMNRSDFEVFHYRDHQLRSVGLHYHDFYEVYYFRSGQVEYRVEGQVYLLQPGDLLLLPPQKLHQVLISPGIPYERMVLWLQSSYLQSLGPQLSACFQNHPGNGHLLKPTQAQSDRIGQIFHRLVRESGSNELYADVLCQGLLMELMVELNRLVPQSPAPVQKQQYLMDQVLTHIENHYWEKITLESLADTFFVSKYHLSHQFRNRVGTSVYQYILFRRLTLAKELMADGAAPGQVYRSCGFCDYANFYRAFRAQYGISPQAFFRKKPN